MSKKLIISARTWGTFVESLKANLKHNFGTCEKTSFKNGYYSAILVTGVDKAYISRLNTVTGEETESTLDLCDFLGSSVVPVPQQLVAGVKELVKAVDVDLDKPLKPEAVNTSIKRVNKGRTRKES